MTFTKEEQIQAIYDLKVGYKLGHADIAMLKSMARQLLAGMEQEPVAYMYKDNLHTDPRFSLHTRFGNWSQEDISKYEITEIQLYAAPPAPVVPDEMLSAMEEVLRISDRDHDSWHKAKAGIVSCRAAMLQGAEPVHDQHESAGSACKCRISEKVQVLQEVQEQGSPALDMVQSVGIPDGYVLVPVALTSEMREAARDYFGISDIDLEWAALLAAAPDFREIQNSSTNNCRENAETSTNGWIPCSERMPERDYVLAADFSGAYYLPSLPNTQVGIYADWFADGKPSWDDGDGNDLYLKQVTHWMALPAAPQQEVK